MLGMTYSKGSDETMYPWINLSSVRAYVVWYGKVDSGLRCFSKSFEAFVLSKGTNSFKRYRLDYMKEDRSMILQSRSYVIPT